MDAVMQESTLSSLTFIETALPAKLKKPLHHCKYLDLLHQPTDLFDAWMSKVAHGRQRSES